jgi:hypothetical protein
MEAMSDERLAEIRAFTRRPSWDGERPVIDELIREVERLRGLETCGAVRPNVSIIGTGGNEL